MLQHKSQTTNALTVFIVNVERQFSLKALIIHSDNGSEFINKEYNALLQAKWITHQRSCSYTPQQNRMVERQH